MKKLSGLFAILAIVFALSSAFIMNPPTTEFRVHTLSPSYVPADVESADDGFALEAFLSGASAVDQGVIGETTDMNTFQINSTPLSELCTSAEYLCAIKVKWVDGDADAGANFAEQEDIDYILGDFTE